MTVVHPSRLSEGGLAQTIDFDFSHMTNFAFRRFTPLLTFFLLTTISALAEGTRTWEQSKYEDFLKGTPHGVAISSGGTLELAPGFKLTASTPSSAVWAVTTGARDEIFAATGSPARVYRITSGAKPVAIFQPQELQVQALVMSKNGVLYAATNPDGKVYRLEPNSPRGETWKSSRMGETAMMLSGSRALFVSGRVRRDLDLRCLGREEGARRARSDGYAARRVPDAATGRGSRPPAW